MKEIEPLELNEHYHALPDRCRVWIDLERTCQRKDPYVSSYVKQQLRTEQNHLIEIMPDEEKLQLKNFTIKGNEEFIKGATNIKPMREPVLIFRK